MPSTARVAWIDAWEGASTPSPYSYRDSGQRARDDRYARERTQASAYRYEEGVLACGRARRRPTAAQTYAPQTYVPQTYAPQTYASRTWAPDTAASVVRMSAVREARRGGTEVRRERTDVRDVPAIDNYDWEAAARRRPARDECERVILHTDRSVEARMAATRYYATGATARRPDPWPEAERRPAPKLRVVKRRASSWRLGLLAGVFAAMFIGLMVVAPIITSSRVAGLESAVGQAENQQEQLAADTAALSAQISSLSSPQRVAEQAAQLGLVPANEVSYLSSGEQMLASEDDTTVAGR